MLARLNGNIFDFFKVFYLWYDAKSSKTINKPSSHIPEFLCNVNWNNHLPPTTLTKTSGSHCLLNFFLTDHLLTPTLLFGTQ